MLPRGESFANAEGGEMELRRLRSSNKWPSRVTDLTSVKSPQRGREGRLRNHTPEDRKYRTGTVLNFGVKCL